jgi:hypothetical protein
MSVWIGTLFEGLPAPLLLTGGVLAILVVSFLVWFLVPAMRHWFLLRGVHLRLRALTDPSPAAVKKVFAVDQRLAHLWSQYQDTLHEQTEDRDGQVKVVAVRSTVPAEAFFNSQYVVDARLRTEFFRHLPGIFTGVGIIGTFSGLIGGLSRFRAFGGASATADSSAAIRGDVENLLHEVSRAFLVSAAAIAAAMLVTLVEKLLIASLYRQTEEIAHDIDARYNAGAGEEYLSRLVHASEDSASQSKILKDALVNDLGRLLREVADTQIKASQENNRVLAVAISDTISESLSQPMQDIAGTVRAASGDQSATASRMLQDVLSSFSQRLNELFGGQIAGLNTLNRDAAQSMRDVAQTLGALVTRMESASETSSDTMAKRMAAAIEEMERRQKSINDHTVTFVDQLRALMTAAQAESGERTQATLASLGKQVEGMVDSLRAISEQALDGNRRREESLNDRAASTVALMTGSVEGAVKEMASASVRMQDAVSTIARSTSSALEKMTYGADTLNMASVGFAQAGERVSGVMTQAAAVAGKLGELNGAMAVGASALQQVVSDYRGQRDMMGALVTELRTIVVAAKTEASLTADVLARLQGAAESLSAAQLQADRYLEGVSRVLGEAHREFAEATMLTLDRANTDFHAKLSSAVSLLSSTIQEFDTTLGSR